MIKVGVFSHHKLISEGIQSLLNDLSEIEVIRVCNEKEDLFQILAKIEIHVLLIHVDDLNTPMLNFLTQINSRFAKIKILILSSNEDENTVLRSIKTGAKGFLAKDTTRNDLLEAIYTLRNGFDYYSPSITNIILNKYILQFKDDEDNINGKNLSSREIEILKLWGNSFTNKEIADKLFISMRTVESHKNHIMQKLNLKTTIDLVKYAIRNNLIDV
jgi:DNA-binding NarL/FixJ family response regulator